MPLRALTAVFLVALLISPISKPAFAEWKNPFVTEDGKVKTYDAFPTEIQRTKTAKDFFQNVSVVNVYVCFSLDSSVPIPDWLKPDNVASQISQAIDNRYSITYSDSGNKNKKIFSKPCNDRASIAVMDEPGSLNFITKLFVGKLPLGSSKTPVAMISRYIYRPGYPGSTHAFVEERPQVIDLTEEKKSKEDFDSRSDSWAVSFGNF